MLAFYSDILSGILSGIHSGNLSGMCPDRQPPGWHWVPGSRVAPHCDLELAVEVRQCPTEIWSSQLRSGRRKEGRKEEAGGRRGGASDSHKI